MKNVLALTPVHFLLRLEVGLPFLGLDWPFSLVSGILFVIFNAITEKKYANYTKYWQKYLLLVATSILNGITYTLGVIIKSPPVHPYEHSLFYLNYVRIKAEINILLIISLFIVFCRTFVFLVEWIVILLKEWKRMHRTN